MTPPELPPDSDPDPGDRSDLDSWFGDETAAAGGQPTDGSPTSKRRIVLGAFAVALVAAAVAFTIVLATHGSGSSSAATVTSTTNGSNGGAGGFPGRRGGGTVGSITALSGSTLTIKDFSGASTKVATTSKTTVTKSVSGAVSDIKVGDHVTAIGSGSSGQIAARQVTDSGASASASGPAGGAFPGGGGAGGGGGPGGGGFPGGGSGGNGGGSLPSGGTPNFSFATGTVKSVNGSTMVVLSSSGSTSTVTTSSSTTVTTETAGTVGDLAVGDQVVVTGATKNGVVTATAIREGTLGGFGGRNGGGPPGAGPPSSGVPA